MKINVDLMNGKVRRKDWFIYIIPSLCIGRYYDGWSFTFEWLTFELEINIFADENAEN